MPNRSSSTQPDVRLYSLVEMDSFPPPCWLVKGRFEIRDFGVLYGPPGEGKTFVALDLALSIATGRAWHGHPTTPGTVVYVTGEGRQGLRPRTRAWERMHGVEAGELFVSLEPVQFLDPPHVEVLAVRIEQLAHPAVLVVVDTLARAFVGGDENAAQDMGRFVDAGRRLQARLGCALWVVHHSGVIAQGRKARERGSTALRCAADTMVEIRKSGSTVTMTWNKQKDGEEPEKMAFRLEPEPLVDANGRSSCVLVPTSSAPSSENRLPRTQQLELAALMSLGEGQVHKKQWEEALLVFIGPKVAPRTFDEHRRQLVEGQYVESAERGFYRLTPKGSAIATERRSARHSVGGQAAATAPTPIGGAVQQTCVGDE
jgi:hypothetical protein